MAEQAQQSSGGTQRVVLTALAMNALIALAKFIAGFISGSSSMLAEGAHSVGDTANEVFLLISLKLGDDPPDEEHPFGHGQDRFLWSFFAAMFIFFAGAIFSVIEGVEKITSSGESGESFTWGYIVLALSFIFEAVSFVVSVREVRHNAKAEGHTFRQELKVSRNTTLKLPVFEDTAALTGILIAFGGLLLTRLLHSHIYDGIASILIGVLLTALAWKIGTDSRNLLLGASMLKEDRERIHDIILSHDEVNHVFRLLTVHLSPETALVNAEIHVVDGLSTNRVEELIEELTREIREQVPAVTETFIELRSRHESEQESAERQRSRLLGQRDDRYTERTGTT